MLSPRLRQQVFNLWSMFWSGGITNPLTAIEQITYLLFLKRLEQLDKERIEVGKLSLYGRRPNCKLFHLPEDAQNPDNPNGYGIPDDVPNPEAYANCHGHGTCRWSYFKRTSSHDHLNQYVFPWLRGLSDTLKALNNGEEVVGAPMEDAYFQFSAEKTAMLKNAIAEIDSLFKSVDYRSADLMGDIFEYLLSEIQTSGKNGQFRTPRHIIRFLIELLEPDKEQYIVDPTAGTGGFLINSIQYIRRKYTDDSTLVLEWDGTPHRNEGYLMTPEEYKSAIQGKFFVGYDNDRTMARIGWMNMIQHGIDNPAIRLRDTLGKSMPRTESGKYDFVLANPPYTGTIDKADLYVDRFPYNPRKNGEPITNKTELLFAWLILDLLRVGGRAALIVPEGVLFGSTFAYKELRRQLLFNNEVEGVVSLPAGVFQPYTGVKTSVLIFKKVQLPSSQGKKPRTNQVWFYEVAKDGYTLDAKRKPTPEENDLWDALEKWPRRIIESTDYFQPRFSTVRWRFVDDKTLKTFPELKNERDHEWGIHELFKGLPMDPHALTAYIVNQQTPIIMALFASRLEQSEARIAASPGSLKNIRDAFEQDMRALDQLFKTVMDRMLEPGGKNIPAYGHDALQAILKEAGRTTNDQLRIRAEQLASSQNIGLLAKQHAEDEVNWQERVESIIREFAKLDGYDITLRSIHVYKQPEQLPEPKSWAAPVRILLRRNDWRGPDDIIGSHDEYGHVRPEYLEDPEIYERPADNIIKKQYLDPDCIEANDYNLSAGRYKPYLADTIEYEAPAKLIRELQTMEREISERLGRLLTMVEDVE